MKIKQNNKIQEKGIFCLQQFDLPPTHIDK